MRGLRLDTTGRRWGALRILAVAAALASAATAATPASAATTARVAFRNADRLAAGTLRVFVETSHCVLTGGEGGSDLAPFGTPGQPTLLGHGAEVAHAVASAAGRRADCPQGEASWFRLRFAKAAGDSPGAALPRYSATVDVLLGDAIRIEGENLAAGSLSLRQIGGRAAGSAARLFAVDWYPLSATRRTLLRRADGSLLAELRCDEPAGRVCSGKLEVHSTPRQVPELHARGPVALGAYRLRGGERGSFRLLPTPRGGLASAGASDGPAGAASAAELEEAPSAFELDVRPFGGGAAQVTRLGLGRSDSLLLVGDAFSYGAQACLFQTPAPPASPLIAPVIWLAGALAPPPGVLRFDWGPDLGFVAGTGEIEDGAQIETMQYLATAPGANDVVLTAPGGLPTLFAAGPAPASGERVVQADATVPFQGVVAGVGQSGAATLVAPAVPDLDLFFPIATRLWITTSWSCFVGQVVGEEMLASAAEVVFPPGTSALQADFVPPGVWQFRPL